MQVMDRPKMMVMQHGHTGKGKHTEGPVRTTILEAERDWKVIYPEQVCKEFCGRCGLELSATEIKKGLTHHIKCLEVSACRKTK